MYAIVTGGTDGMGLLTALKLCELGYEVTLSARSDEKGCQAVNYIKEKAPDAKVNFLLLDLGNLASVRDFGSNYFNLNNKALHLLVNNAGILMTEGYSHTTTIDGLELHFQINHLGHFLLTSLLLPLLFKAGSARVVNVSSVLHLYYKNTFDNIINEVQNGPAVNDDIWMFYNRSKLANVLSTRYLAKKFPYETNHVTFNALHPGLVRTKMVPTEELRQRAKPVEDGIRCAMFLSVSPDVEGTTGKYFNEDCTEATSPDCISELAQSDVEAEKLWYASLFLCGMDDEQYGT